MGGFVANPIDGIVDGARRGDGAKPKGKGKGKAMEARGEPQPTGRRVQPSGRGEGREGGGPDDPRRRAPGALDPRATVESKQEGKGKGRIPRKETGGDNEDEAKSGKGAGGETPLPPMREFIRPAKTRETLVREAEAIDQRLAATTADGGQEHTVAQLQREKEQVEKSIKVAGGKTKRALLFSIKTEEEMQEKSERAVERCKERIKEREDQIKDIREGIRQDLALLERHNQRGQAAAQRLAFLAVQKAGESLPADFIEKVRIAALAVRESSDCRLDPLEDFLSAMLPAPQEFNIGDDDGNSTVPGMDSGGQEDAEGIDLFDEEKRQEIVCARARLAEEQRKLEQAIDGALRGKQVKRRSGEDQPKDAKDEEMHEEEVATLTPEQTADLFRQRIKEAEADLRQLESGSKKEIIPVEARRGEALAEADKATGSGPTSEGGRRPAGKGPQCEKERGQDRSRQSEKTTAIQEKTAEQEPKEEPKWTRVGDRTRRSRWSDEDEAGEAEEPATRRKTGREGERDAHTKEEKQSEALEIVPMEVVQRREGEERKEHAKREERWLRGQIQKNNEANCEIAYQERLQRQQEQEREEELRMVKKMGMVRVQAAELEKRRTKPY